MKTYKKKYFKTLKPINYILNFFALLILVSLLANIILLNFTPAFLFMALCIFIITLPNLIYPVLIKPWLESKKKPVKTYDRFNTAFFIISILLVVFLIFFITFNVNSSKELLPKNNEELTVIVLGSGIKDGRPMSNLKSRLDAAGEYLSTHKNANCIVSGGLNPYENLIEADVMKAYLTDNWEIDENRIEKESTSKDTYQNLKHSKEIINQHNLSENILIITNDFHMFRSVLYSKSLGYTDIYTQPVKTKFVLLTTFWFREILSMIKAILLVNWPSLFGY